MGRNDKKTGTDRAAAAEGAAGSSGQPARLATLRREVPSTVGLLGDAGDFAAMRRAYRSFTFHDHPHYLGQMETLLRDLAAQGVHVAVGLFDPGQYAEYCQETGQDPDTPVARARYTADVTAGGPTVPYAGQPLDDLLSQLAYATDRQSTWERATDLLAEAGECADCGGDLAQEAFGRASVALMRLLETAATGRRHLVCSVPAGGTHLLAALHTRQDDQGRLHFAEAEALVFCTVLAAGIVTETPGGVVLRSETGGGTEEVRGWTLRDGWLQPLTEAEVFDAYCTDITSGDPVPPEPGVEYRPGIPLPEPDTDRLPEN